MIDILPYIIGFILVVSITLGVGYLVGLIVGISFLQTLQVGIVWTILMAVVSFSMKGLQAQIKSK